MNSDQFGRLLFEKRAEPIALGVPFIGSLLFILCAVFFLTSDDQEMLKPDDRFGIGIYCCIGSGVLAFATFMIWSTKLLVFEKCIRKDMPFSSTCLQFDEIDTISFSTRRRYATNRVYIGSRYFFQLSSGSTLVNFDLILNQDSDIEVGALTKYICTNIAEKLLQHLDEVGVLPWTRNLTIVRDGVAYLQDSNWNHRPFHEIGTCKIENGVFSLRAINTELPLVQTETIAPNFFPGLIVLQRKAILETTGDPWTFPIKSN